MSEAAMRLADLCDFVRVQVDPANHADGVYVGLEHVVSGRFVRIGEGKASDVRSAKYAFQPSDVLYGKLRPYLDKAVISSDSGICTTELLVLRPRNGVDPRFLVGVVHTPTFVEYAVSGTTGVQHPRTSWNHICNFELPEFNSDEQKNIAKLLWEVHDAITANEVAIEVGADLKRAVMRTLFTKGLRGEAQRETEIGPVPGNWNVVNVGSLFEITQGISLKGNLSTSSDGIPFLRTSNVYWGRIDIAKVSRMLTRSASLGDRWLEKGDLLVCEGGEIGRAAVWQGEIANATYQNHLHRLIPRDRSAVDSRFAMLWLEVGFLDRKVYEGVGNKTTIPNLSGTRLAELLMPLPPTLDEQCEIVAILDAIDRKIDLHRRKRTVLDDLFKALLHKLMTGGVRVADLDLSVPPAIPRSTTAQNRQEHAI